MQYLVQLAEQAGHRLDVQNFERTAWIKASQEANMGRYEAMAAAILSALDEPMTRMVVPQEQSYPIPPRGSHKVAPELTDQLRATSAPDLDRRVTPYRSDLADERLRGKVDAARFTPGTVQQVCVTSAPLRRQPSPDAPLDTEALMGELVTVYDEHEGWAWGQLHDDGYVGYLQTAFLDEPGPEPTHKVKAIRTFVYPGPNLKLPVLTFLSINSRVAVSEVEGDYARVESGWVYAQHLARIDAHEPDPVAVAERLIGTPYLWGGKTSLGLDCSGLAQTALHAAGISAPRDSDMQENGLGSPVELRPDLGGLRRGDLVFWKGHVGLMLDPLRLLHATGHSMSVLVEPLAVAEERIRTGSYGPITSVKRLRNNR